MGRPRVKTIDSAIDLEKSEKADKKNLEISEAVEKKVEGQVKTVKKTTAKKSKKERVRSKRYEEVIKHFDKTKEYTLEDAIEIIKKYANTKFEPSLEAHLNLNTDSSKSDQLIRKSINLPHSSGKTFRVLVFGGDSKKLKHLGVEIGTEAALKKIDSGKVDVDKVIATSDWMPKLTKSAKILGPKGLVPNPKSGTITDKPEELVKNLQGGMVEVKSEKASIIHTVVGKVSSPNKKLEENVKALISEVRKSKPESLKKELIRSVYLSSTMGPSVRIDKNSL